MRDKRDVWLFVGSDFQSFIYTLKIKGKRVVKGKKKIKITLFLIQSLKNGDKDATDLDQTILQQESALDKKL